MTEEAEVPPEQSAFDTVWLYRESIEEGAPESLLVGAAKEIERLRDENDTLRTMVDHPDVLAMLAGPGGSTCTKVIGDDEVKWLRNHWRNALNQWTWWQHRYQQATGDERPRTAIEMAELRAERA